ncbi:class I SAM-dependent methyltransferase [Microbacterium sp. 179-B 1A2 NHS]|uniref:class I SAM-dependent methyltransferase n=1 Tax=Microbacterium sp. 179-B 1A2 NHS TaxID=3142383 RepID=UPI0039A3751F
MSLTGGSSRQRSPLMSAILPAASADDIAERLVQAMLGWAEINAVYLGDRLGWYRSLRADGPATADELAARTQTSPRYAREWLEQQAITGILSADDETNAARRRYTLPAGAAETLTDEHSLAFAGPLARLAAAAGTQLPALLEAYRTGGGVSWQQLGEDARESQAALNRPWFDRLPEAFAGVERVDAVLRRPGARAADVGMGGGWSSIALAQGYPDLRVDGFDVDAPSVATARENAEAAGVADRVRFHLADAGSLERAGTFDAVFAFECVHDMSQPVDVLRAMRRAVTDDGIVIVMDEAVGEHFGGPGGEFDPLMYAFSLFVCLPDGMSDQPSAATGTVMRPGILRGYARDAGFADVTTLPIEGFSFFRFYDLLLRG